MRKAATAVLTAALLLVSPAALAQRDLSAEARAAVNQTLYAASATSAAQARNHDSAFVAQRRDIDALAARVRDARNANASLTRQLAVEQGRYVDDLARRDRAYAQEVAVLRSAVEDLASTQDGLEALTRFNAGDELGALTALDALREARIRARAVRDNVESAAEGRNIAYLANEARARGRVDTQSVLVRWEDVVALDPLMWDWIHLARLYADAGRTVDVQRATRAALALAQTDAGRIAVLMEIVTNQSDRFEVQSADLEQLLRLALAQVQADPQSIAHRTDLIVALGIVSRILASSGDRDTALALNQTARVQIAETRVLSAVTPRDLLFLREVEANSYLADVEAHLRVQDYAGVADAAGRAIPLLRALSAEDGENVWLMGQLAFALANQGVAQGALRRGDPLPALGEARELRRRQSNADMTNIQALTGLSFASRQYARELEERGRVAEATAAYVEAFEAARRIWDIDPDHIPNLQEAAQAMDALGAFYFRQNRFADAAQVFTTAVEGWGDVYRRFPNAPIVVTNMENFSQNLAQAYRNMGDMENAVRYFELAVEADWTGVRNLPENTYYRRRIPNLRLTICALTATPGRAACYAAHLSDVDRLISLFPADTILRTHRCLGLSIASDRASAVAACDAVLTAEPRNVSALGYRGLASLKARDWTRARADFNAAIAIEPENAFALFGRGLARLGAGDSGGRQDTARALALNAALADQFTRYGAPDLR